MRPFLLFRPGGVQLTAYPDADGSNVKCVAWPAAPGRDEASR